MQTVLHPCWLAHTPAPGAVEIRIAHGAPPHCRLESVCFNGVVLFLHAHGEEETIARHAGLSVLRCVAKSGTHAPTFATRLVGRYRGEPRKALTNVSPTDRYPYQIAGQLLDLLDNLHLDLPASRYVGVYSRQADVAHKQMAQNGNQHAAQNSRTEIDFGCLQQARLQRVA